MEWPKITCFGDSITRRSKDPDFGCWSAHLAQETLSYYDVEVRGFGGYNTRWSLEQMPILFPRSYLNKVEIFIIFFGHNDSWQPGSPMHIPLNEYEQNTRAMIDYLKVNGLDSSKIILITPAWYFKDDFENFLKETGFPPMVKLKEVAEKYADAIRRIAKDSNISCVDFYRVTADHQPLQSLFCDGVHLSRHGAKILFEKLWPVVEGKIVDRHGKTLEDLFHVVPYKRLPVVKLAIEAHQAMIPSHDRQ